MLGIEEADNEEDIDWLCRKITGLRIFDDENGVMNRSILETGGDILVISQFTLMASYKKGNRPRISVRPGIPQPSPSTKASAGNWAKRSANPCRRENSEQK